MMPALNNLDQKRLLFSLPFRILVIFLFGFILSSVSAGFSNIRSETPLEQAQQDYSYQLTKYQDLKDKFENAKENYKTYNTVISKTDAFLKTKDYLIQINDVYITYLLLISERSNSYDWGKGIYSKNDEDKIIEEQISLLKTFESEAQNLSTLEEAVTYSQKLKNHVEKNTLPAAYIFLSKTDISQLLEARYDFLDLAEKIDTFSRDKVKESDKQVFLNWQNQIQTVSEYTNSKINIKNDEIKKIAPGAYLKYDLSDYKFSTTEERKLFTDSPKLLMEILNFI